MIGLSVLAIADALRRKLIKTATANELHFSHGGPLPHDLIKQIRNGVRVPVDTLMINKTAVQGVMTNAGRREVMISLFNGDMYVLDVQDTEDPANVERWIRDNL